MKHFVNYEMHIIMYNDIHIKRSLKIKCVLVAQSCPALCDPMGYSLTGSSLSMGFSRQEYLSGLPFPPPGDLSDPGIKPRCSA